MKMAKYIDASVFLNEKIKRDRSFGKSNIILDKIVEIINRTPAADVQEVKHGKWNYIPETFYTIATFVCSVCKHYQLSPHAERDYLYCPVCGAKMDGKENEENAD